MSAQISGLKKLWAVRRWARLLGLGFAEQAVTSIANFLFVVILARTMGARALGEFSLAWSILMLAESVLWGLFGDAVPAIAFKLPPSRFKVFRASLYMLSAGASLICVAIGVMAAIVALWLLPHYAPLIFAAALGSAALRAQQMFRRLCYLDLLRGLAFVGACVYAAILLGGGLLLPRLGAGGSVGAMVCFALACGAVGLMILVPRGYFSRPSVRVVAWSARRLWSSGKWLVAAAFGFWAVSTGLIPAAGLLYGVTASGAMRVIQNLMTPLAQVVQVVNSIILPVAAEKLKRPTRRRFVSVAVQPIVLFAAVSVPYALAVIFLGPAAVKVLFHNRIEGLTLSIFTLSSLAAVLDTVRAGASVPLLAVNVSRPTFICRTVALAVLLTASPVAIIWRHLDSLLLIVVIANLAAVLVALISLRRVSLRFPVAEPATASRVSTPIGQDLQVQS